MLEWRKFNFFELKQYGDQDAFSNILSDSDIVCSTSGNSQIILGDSCGFIHVFPKNFRDSYSFKAHNSITHCELSTQNNLLVTLGTDETADSLPEFKVWNLNKLNKSVPACVRNVKTNLQRATSLAVSENGLNLAIGFERGNLTLYKGDITRDKAKSVKNVTFGTAPIKGITFKQVGKISHLFVCSDSGVYLYTIHSRDKEIKNVLDTNGPNIATNCCWLQQSSNSEGYFMAGRDDAIYCYTPEGRAPCYAFEGRKVLIRWFRNHLLMVTCPIMENPLQTKPYTLTVIDVNNRFIVFTTQIEVISSVFVEFGTCFILTKNKLLYHLDEKDLQSKLQSLYKKNMYDTAVKIAKNNQYNDAEGLSDIFKNYGDHLYAKGNFSSAVEQYIKTIGYLEPSYVIRRFLDSRHTQYLTDYLQSIHKEGKASTDHTTLLLNCFTRLDRIDELKSFLENYRQNHFDIDVAISVCRKSCIDQALNLAKFNEKHNHAISIMIEDLKDYENAIEYITKLSYDDAEKNIMKYGSSLMDHVPQKLIVLLKKLCTDYVAKKCDESTIKEEEDHDIFTINYRNGGFIDDREQATPEDFIHLFGDSKQLIDYIEYLIRNLPTCSKVLYNSLIEHYLTLWKISLNPSNERAGLEQRLVELIKNYSQFYDSNHVLVLCQTYEFWLGAMLIYEEKKLYNLIVRHYLNTKDFPSLYTLCKRLGTTDPSIWLATLNGLKSCNQVPSSFLQETLQVIASEKLQSPLQVLNVLTSIDKGPNLSTVRSYFMQIFQKEDDFIRKDRESAEKYHSESEELKQNIETINRDAIEFRSSLCDACHQQLSFPSIFFLCKHSFHMDCIRSFSETEKDCMVCRKKNSQLLDMMHVQNESRNKNHVFQEKLENTHEQFSVIADYFSRGLFNKIVLLSDDEDENRERLDDINISRKNLPPRHVEKTLPNISEAKMRVEENLRTNVEHKAQLSEGRMRLQEQSYKLSKPVERQQVPQKKVSLPITQQREKQEIKAAYPITNNPFDDESDDDKNPFKDDANYDDKLNPFADTDEAEEVIVKSPPISANPFDDDDD